MGSEEMDSNLTMPVVATLTVGLLTAIIYFLLSRPKVEGKNLPKKMKRLVVLETAEGSSFADLKHYKVAVEEVDVPTPEPGQVLVKMVAAAVNPSDEVDLCQASREAGNPKEIKLPKVFGREGCGVVVASGGGVMASMMVGKKVGVCSIDGETWQEYVCMPAQPPSASMLDQSLPVETGASFFVNPLTAVGLCDVAKSKGSPAFIHTVGNSQLGQMMIKLAKSEGVTIVNMVRKEEGVAPLKSLGAEYVVVTSRDGWQEELQMLIRKLNISVVFDAIAGDMTGTLMKLLPAKSTTIVYGLLSGPFAGNLPVVDMIYEGKKMEAFYLASWLTEGGMLKTILRIRSCFKRTMHALGEGGWAESQFEDCRMEDMWLKLCKSQSKAKKLRIRMDI